MVITAKKSFYRAFGLIIESEIGLPELPECSCNQNQADVVIEKADLTLLWKEMYDGVTRFVTSEGLIMFKISGAAIYAIKDGNRIYVSPMAGSDENQIRLFILGTSMGAILMQRRILPLHGSALAVGGKAFAIVGASGAGKSTLASVFLNEGYQFVSDDLIPITLNQSGAPYVTPAYPQQKLWVDTMNQFGMEEGQYKPLINRAAKFAIPVHKQFVTEPLSLYGVFELVKTSQSEVEFNPVSNLDRLYKLYKHTFRKTLINQVGLLDWHFKTVAKISGKINFHQIKRPNKGFTVHELKCLIESNLYDGGDRDEQKAKVYSQSIG